MAAPLNRYQAAGAGAGLAAVLAIAGPLIAKYEGFSNDPYLDVAKVWTVCRGQTNVPMRRYSDAECERFFQAALIKHASPVLKCLPADAPVTLKAAFTSHAYNFGPAATCGSLAAQHARAGRYELACLRLAVRPDGKPAWSYAGGKYYRGLERRRQEERAICESGL